MRTKRISLLVALVFLIGAMILPMTAFAAGGKDTTPPTLTAVLDGETVKIVSSDDNSGVEAVYIDKTRVNSLVDGKASVALKDYAGTDKKVSVSAALYAGNRPDAAQLVHPNNKEPASPHKPAAPTQPSQSSTPATKPVQTQAASSGSTGTQSSSSNTGTDSGGTSSQDGSSGSTGNSGTPEPPLPPSRRALSPRRGPGPCWTAPPARMGINSFTPLPPRPGMCSTLSLTASVTTTTFTF